MSCNELITVVLCLALGLAFIIFSVKQITWAVKQLLNKFKKKNEKNEDTKPTDKEDNLPK